MEGSQMKYIYDKDTIPKTAHYAVLEFSSVYIPGDERSRTNPGHGYPAHSESTVNYIAFESEYELNNWVQKQQNSPYTQKNWAIIHAEPKTVKVTTHII